MLPIYFYYILQITCILAVPEFTSGEDQSINYDYLSSLQAWAGYTTVDITIYFSTPFSQNPQILLSVVSLDAGKGFNVTPQDITTSWFTLRYKFQYDGFNGARVQYLAVVDDNLQIDNFSVNLPTAPQTFVVTLNKIFTEIPNALIFLNGYDYAHGPNLKLMAYINSITTLQYSWAVTSSNSLSQIAVSIIIGTQTYLEVNSDLKSLGEYSLSRMNSQVYYNQIGLNRVQISGLDLKYDLQELFDNQICSMKIVIGSMQPPLTIQYVNFVYKPCGQEYFCNNLILATQYQQCYIQSQGCVVSYYADLIVNQCIKCSSNCDTCANSPANCLTCSNPSFSLPQCVCGDHQYLDQNNQCQECPAWCSQCDGSQCIQCATNCITCNYTTCLTCLATNYYISNGLCVQCLEGCALCNEFGCLSCLNPLQIVNGQCAQNCISPCLTCNFGQCLTCPTNYYPASTSCLPCQNNCVNCLNSVYCISCDLSQYMTLSQYNQCICIQGYTQVNDICIKQDEQITQESEQQQLIISNCAQAITINNVTKCKKCIYGYSSVNGSCQQCDMKCLDCLEQVNVCTVCRFNIQNTDQTSCQLCEFQAGYYSDYSTNLCYTICGDGIIAGNEQCDDFLQPIGCSNCQALSTYTCNQSECELTIYPIPTLIEISDVYQIYNSTKVFLLSYNTQLASFDPNITIKLFDQSINFTYQLIAINQSYYVKLKFQNTSINQSMTVSFNNQNIQSLIGQIQQIKFVNIQISDSIIISETTKIVVEGVSQGVNIILILFLILVGISILFGGLDIYWNLLDLLQRLSYLKYINTIFPYNMNEIIQLFSYVQISNLPYMEYLNIQIFMPTYVEQIEAPYLIANDGYTCNISQNILPILVPWIISFCIFYLSKVLQSPMLYINMQLPYDALQNKIIQLQRYICNKLTIINQSWKWSGMIRLYQSSAYDICFVIALSLYGLNSLKLYDQLLTYSIIILHLSIIYVCFHITSFKLYALEKYDERYGAVIEGLEVKKEKLLFNNFTFLKKGMFVICLVLFYSEPIFQIFSIVLFQLSQILSLINLNPLKNRTEQIKQIICEALMTISELLIALLVIDDQYYLFTYDERAFIGWIWICCISIIIAAQLLIDVFQQTAIFKKETALPIDINNLKI